VDDYDGCMAFIGEVGFPVIVKPDNGVGASHTYKLDDEDELRFFLENWDGERYIMEEFVTAEVNSYDAIINGDGEPIFETGNVSPISIMDIVNEGNDTFFYIVKDLAEDVRAAGRAAVKAFGVRSRFVHFEFFRLACDQPMGKKGDVVALEVNMRPSGGYSPDMMNFANSTDVYKIWADMIAFDRSTKPAGEHYYCAYAGRRDSKRFALTHDALCQKYASQLRMVARVPEALSGAMSDQMYLAVFPTEEELFAYFEDVSREE
jgi:biotin carboxylase